MRIADGNQARNAGKIGCKESAKDPLPPVRSPAQSKKKNC